jgi:hypothetical protein
LARVGADSPAKASSANRCQYWKVAQEVYADYPALLQAARETLGM